MVCEFNVPTLYKSCQKQLRTQEGQDEWAEMPGNLSSALPKSPKTCSFLDSEISSWWLTMSRDTEPSPSPAQ